MGYSKRVIVFGSTGTIGTKLIEILSSEHPDWHILAATRDVSRTSRLAKMGLPNVTMIQADPLKKLDVLEVTKTCDIIFSCIGFHRYERSYWAKHWPPLMASLLEATGSNKKLVFYDNLYAFGPTIDINPTTKVLPASNKSKPEIQAQLHKMIEEHMDKYPGTVAVIGGSDIFGPYAQKTLLGEAIIEKIVKDEPPIAFGSSTVVHDFCFAHDLARAMALAADQDRAYGKFWVCPHSIHHKTVREISNDVAIMAGKRAPVDVRVMDKVSCYLLSPFDRVMGEMIEMMPYWSNEYRVDESDFVREFGLKATPYEQALRETVDFYMRQAE